MPDIKVYLKNRLSELSSMYRINAELSALAINNGNFEVVTKLYNELNIIAGRVADILKITSDEDEVKNVKNLNLIELPDYMQAISLIDAYTKLLSLKYTNFETDDLEEIITLNKMSIDFKYDEDIPFLIIGRALYDNKYYSDVLRLCEYIETFSTGAPVWSLYGDTYRALGEYGLAIKSYQKYLELNKNDEDALKTLDELYEEALK